MDKKTEWPRMRARVVGNGPFGVMIGARLLRRTFVSRCAAEAFSNGYNNPPRGIWLTRKVDNG